MPIELLTFDDERLPDAAMKMVVDRVRQVDDIQEVFSFGEFFGDDAVQDVAKFAEVGPVAAISVQQVEAIEGSQSTTHKSGVDEYTFEIFTLAQDLYDRGNQHYEALRAAQRVREHLQGEFLLSSPSAVQSAPMQFQSVRRFIDNGSVGVYRLNMTMRIKYEFK